jgi:hypothetical protein
MRRTNTKNGAKFTPRGQVYIQTGSFEHEISYGRFVRVLELKTECPECGATFEVTASLRQIEQRMLVRRCKPCRNIHRGPVDVRKIEQRKAKKEAQAREQRRWQIVLHRAKRRKAAALPGTRAAPEMTVAAASVGAHGRQPPAIAVTPPVTPAAALLGVPVVTSPQADDLAFYSGILGRLA